MNNELYHYGVVGMKWGVRRYQNKDGSLTEEGRTRKGIKKLEARAVKEKYKSDLKNGGNHLFKFVRTSTGANYDKAVDKYQKQLESNKELKRLSKEAHNAEMDRLLLEKKVYDKFMSKDIFDTDGYNDELYELYGSKKYLDADTKSQLATDRYEKYLQKLSDSYIDQIKEAKLSDLNISGKDREIAKQWISDRFRDYYWDGNLQWNPDNYYEPGMEIRKFK